jgi:DNA polymerase III alpha subunit (gram-positive type)
MNFKREVFISVDVETSGPVPAEFSLLSIGACHVDDEALTFYRELKPINGNADPKALEVSGFSLEELSRTGSHPPDVMSAFAEWIKNSVGGDGTPVFVGFNAPFDWSFINYYFHKFAGANPFGFSALDVKAYFMGATGCGWRDTRSSAMEALLVPKHKGDHHALHDAQYQAELFRLIREKAESR